MFGSRSKFAAAVIASALLGTVSLAYWNTQDKQLTPVSVSSSELTKKPSVKNVSTLSPSELADIPPEALHPQPPMQRGYNASSGQLPPGALPPGVTLPGMSMQGGRTTAQGYGMYDGVRQQFTGKERDNETGLDYFGARYYSSVQGRFTSPDEFSGGPREVYSLGKGDPVKQALPYADITNPQSLNKYSYAYNNPLRFVDPDGHCGTPSGLSPGRVGICVASYIQSFWVPRGNPPGRGDNRGPNGQGGTSRIEVRVAVDLSQGTVTKTDETMGTSGAVFKELGPKGKGGVQVSPPGKDEQGNLYFQINQHGTSSTPMALLGSIDNHLNIVVTTDGRVGITPGSTAKDYPSLEVFKYTVDAKGNVTTTLIRVETESGNILDLRKKERPIQADPK